MYSIRYFIFILFLLLVRWKIPGQKHVKECMCTLHYHTTSWQPTYLLYCVLDSVSPRIMHIEYFVYIAYSSFLKMNKSFRLNSYEQLSRDSWSQPPQVLMASLSLFCIMGFENNNTEDSSKLAIHFYICNTEKCSKIQSNYFPLAAQDSYTTPSKVLMACL